MALVPVVQVEFRCAASLPPRASSDQSITVPRAWRQIKLANPANSFANRQRCSSRGFAGVYAGPRRANGFRIGQDDWREGPVSHTRITRRDHGGRPRRCHVTQPRAGSNVRAKRKSGWKPEHPSRRRISPKSPTRETWGHGAGSDSPAQALGLNSLLPGRRAGSKALPAGSSTSSRRRTCD
jgi:hypothetical protein